MLKMYILSFKYRTVVVEFGGGGGGGVSDDHHGSLVDDHEWAFRVLFLHCSSSSATLTRNTTATCSLIRKVGIM